MVSAGDFKNGLTIELDGNVYQIVEFSMLSRVRVLLLFAPSLRISRMAV